VSRLDRLGFVFEGLFRELHAKMSSAARTQPAAGAKRVLIVEDELMIRMLLIDMVGELGYTIAAEAAQIEEALDAARNTDFDIAILDVNLNGRPVSPVADALAARGRPFIFVTGYADPAVEELHANRPVLKKPFHLDNLKLTLQEALGNGTAGSHS
jgi:CheY-like chemotaxis protein